MWLRGEGRPLLPVQPGSSGSPWLQAFRELRPVNAYPRDRKPYESVREATCLDTLFGAQKDSRVRHISRVGYMWIGIWYKTFCYLDRDRQTINLIFGRKKIDT